MATMSKMIPMSLSIYGKKLIMTHAFTKQLRQTLRMRLGFARLDYRSISILQPIIMGKHEIFKIHIDCELAAVTLSSLC